MQWYWIVLILGVIAPWIVMGKAIRIAFEERGVLTGLATWFGMCFVTVPLIFLGTWIAGLLFG
jgi:hypothetical protein